MFDSVSGEPDIDPEDIVRALLEATHTIEPPTNAERLAREVGLTVRGFSHHEFRLDPRIRAFLWPARGLIGFDRKLTFQRRTYSILHELGHYVLPGHITNVSEDYKIVDEDRTLSVANVIQQEIEANKFASDCLFQLERFNFDIHDKELGWKNIQMVADVYGASFEATARRWVENSEKTCALIVFNPSSSETEAPLRIMYTVTSDLFRENHFSKLALGQEISADTLVHRVFHGLEYQENPQENFRVTISGQIHDFQMSLFTNGYRMFGLLRPHEQ